MNQNLHTLLSGPYYINPMYAMACLPTLYKSVADVSYIEKSEADIIASVINTTASTSPDSTSSATMVAILNFNQPVVKYNYGGWLGTQTFMRILDGLAADPSIAGVVINFDCGGGQVYGTGEFYDYLVSFPKPYVAFTHGYLCSGAYYLAAPAKKIIVNPRADAIGSIGAYATIIDTNGILEHFGGKVHTIYATKSTDKNSEYREVIENSNYEPYIKNSLDPIVETFHSDMKAVRPMLNDAVFGGGTWTGANAVEMGLADATGTLQDAVNAVFELADQQISKSQKSNTMSNTKQLPKVQAVLGLDAPLASSDAGSYLNLEQLDAIEARLDGLETEASTAATALADATSAHETAIAAASADLTSVSADLDAMLTDSGLEVTGSLPEKVAALSAHVSEMNIKDGSSHTQLNVDAEIPKGAPKVIGGYDVSAALNN